MEADRPDIEHGTWRGATLDSRRVEPGMLFVALQGEKCDGRKFIPDALAKGAAGVIIGRDALAEAARTYRATLKAKVIGVTGSAGKTTVKEFLKTFLGTIGRTYGTEGNYNNDLGLPLTILNTPRDAEFLVLEAGTNHPGEIRYLADIARPDAAALASIGTAHIEFFGSQEGIAREKGQLFTASHAFAVMPKGCACANILRGLASCDVFEADPAACPLVSPLPGAHNRANLAVAWEAARRWGAQAEACAEALRTFTLPGERWHKVEKAGMTFISDCYNANPTSMIAALETFAAEKAPGRKVAVLGDMFELGEQSAALHAEVRAKAAALGLDAVLYVGENFGGGTFEEAQAALRPGDTVFLKASHGMHFERFLA